MPQWSRPVSVALGKCIHRNIFFESLQILRFGQIKRGLSYLDDANPHAGWKTVFGGAHSFVRFNEVDFGRGARRSVEVRVKSSSMGAIEIRLDRPDGPMIARVTAGKAGDWQNAKAAPKKTPSGVHDLFVTAAEAVEVDWIRFR